VRNVLLWPSYAAIWYRRRSPEAGLSGTLSALARASMLVGRPRRTRRRIREGSSRRDGRRLIDALLRRRVMDRPSASIRATTVVSTTPLPVRLDYRLPRSLAKAEIARMATHHRPNGGTYGCPFLFPSLLGNKSLPSLISSLNFFTPLLTPPPRAAPGFRSPREAVQENL